MQLYRLLALFPLAYIILWFYALFAWAIPTLSTQLSNVTLGTIGAIVIFFTGGIIVLLITIFLFFLIMVGD